MLRYTINMKQEIKWFVFVLGLGMSLIAYANANFITRDYMELVLEDIRYMKSKIDRIHDKVYK